MSEAPERIWLLPEIAIGLSGQPRYGYTTNYIRADIAAERERKLVVALDQAARALDWAARQMKGNCTGSAVNATMLAAGNATAVREELGYE